jgi:hypothetical protein
LWKLMGVVIPVHGARDAMKPRRKKKSRMSAHGNVSKRKTAVKSRPPTMARRKSRGK